MCALYLLGFILLIAQCYIDNDFWKIISTFLFLGVLITIVFGIIDHFRYNRDMEPEASMLKDRRDKQKEQAEKDFQAKVEALEESDKVNRLLAINRLKEDLKTEIYNIDHHYRRNLEIVREEKNVAKMGSLHTGHPWQSFFHASFVILVFYFAARFRLTFFTFLQDNVFWGVVLSVLLLYVGWMSFLKHRLWSDILIGGAFILCFYEIIKWGATRFGISVIHSEHYLISFPGGTLFKDSFGFWTDVVFNCACLVIFLIIIAVFSYPGKKRDL